MSLLFCSPQLSKGKESEVLAAAEAAESLRRLARLDAQLLYRDAMGRAQEEAARGGLVIVAAFYGDVQEGLADRQWSW